MSTIGDLSRHADQLETRIKATEETLAAIRRQLEALKERRAPVQGWGGGIPWSMHLKAYEAYCKKYGPQEALVEGNCRGGFGTNELDDLIPGWRGELSGLDAMKKEIIDLRSELARYKLIAFSPTGDNHHNAIDCPYCNPDGVVTLTAVYPCCEGARRIEQIPGDATTLLGGVCEIHGLTIHKPKPRTGREEAAWLAS